MWRCDCVGTKMKSVFVKLDLRTYVVGTCLQSTIFDVFTLPSSSEVWKWGPEMDLSCLWVATAMEKHLLLDTECTEVGKYLSLLATKNKCFDTLVNDNNHLIITDFTMIIPIRDVRTASHCTSVLLAQGPWWHCGPLCLNSWSQVIMHNVIPTKEIGIIVGLTITDVRASHVYCFYLTIDAAYLAIRMFHQTTKCRGDNYTGKNFLPSIKTRSLWWKQSNWWLGGHQNHL